MDKNFRLKLIYFSVLIVSSSVHADVLLLAHGFQSNLRIWEQSGITPILERYGWHKSDFLMTSRQGIVPFHTPEKLSPNKIVSLQLSSELPLRVQADQFTAALRYLQDFYPNEPLIIVGHSLGGLTARLALVKNNPNQVKALITIATPHLGTRLAEYGMQELNDNIFSQWAKRMFGGGQYQALERSQPVIYDLLPERPGNMLYALNRQAHPNLKYISIVRSFQNGTLGDLVVAGYSQDMQNVPALAHKSQRILHGFQHELSANDAYAILNAIELIN